jgi:predicted DNA-binding transcriptional regulator YafY
MVAGRHFKLMRLLHERSCTFDELRAHTGLSERQLHRDLTALHLVGSLVAD